VDTGAITLSQFHQKDAENQLRFGVCFIKF